MTRRRIVLIEIAIVARIVSHLNISRLLSPGLLFKDKKCHLSIIQTPPGTFRRSLCSLIQA